MGRIIARCRNIWNRLLLKTSLSTGLNLGEPAYVCAKMTMRCNSKCLHCNVWKMDFAEHEMTAAQWFRILEELRDWLGRFRMTFTGGEALLREDLPVILEHAVRLGISVELLSNGIIIDDDIARRIIDVGVDQVTISYDGVTPEAHDAFRGESGFHVKTTAAILALRQQREARATPLRILLKTVINAFNLHELAAIAQWTREHDLEVQYQPIEQNYGEKPDPLWYKESPLWIRDLETLRGELNLLRQLQRNSATIANVPADFNRFYEYFAEPETLMASVQAHEAGNRKGRCFGMGNFVISSNGEVRMCFQMEPFGSIASESPKDVWRNRRRCWTQHCKWS